MFTQQRFFTNQKEKQMRVIQERQINSEQVFKHNNCSSQQRDVDNIFKVLLYCDQPLACYMQIHHQFKTKVPKSTPDHLRPTSKLYAVIGCLMRIEECGKITLCSRQNKYHSSQFRVRFLYVKQKENEVQVVMISLIKGSEIKLTMQMNNYYWLLKQLNQNKIKFYSQPLISIPDAWLMVQKQLGQKLQWVSGCIYHGNDNCYVVRIGNRLFIYKIQRAKIELVHTISDKQNLREKADREWCMIGEKWIAFRSICDRQLYKMYFRCLPTQSVSIQKTESKQVEDNQLSNQKYQRTGSRHPTQVNSISSKTIQERMENKIGEVQQKQAAVHKKLEFSMKKEEIVIQFSQRQFEINQEEQVMVDENDRIIIQDNQFDQQQPEKRQHQQQDNAIDEERVDEQIREESDLKPYQVKISIQQIKLQQKIQPKEEANQDCTLKSREESITRKISWSNHKSNCKEVDYYDKENCSKAANSISRHVESKELKIEEQHMSISQVSEHQDIAMDQGVVHQHQSLLQDQQSESNLFGFDVMGNSQKKFPQKSNSKQQEGMIDEKHSEQKTDKLKTNINSNNFLRYVYQERMTSPQKQTITQTQSTQPSTKLIQTHIIKQTKSNENYLADVMQVNSDIFAVLNSRHQLMLCSGDKHYDYNTNSIKLNWKSEILDPTRLFPSLAKQHLHYLQNSTQSIFSFDFNKEKHTQLINYGLLVEPNQIRDVKQTNHHEFIVITPRRIKFIDSRVKQFKSRRDLYYRSEHNDFQKIVMQSATTAVVSHSDGIVKIFDLRATSLRTLNKLVLDQGTAKHKQNGFCGQLKIVSQTQDIFCAYNNSGYVIESQTINSQHSLFERKVNYADRRQINRFKLTADSNQKCFYDISKAGDKVVHWQEGILKYYEVSSHKMKTLWRNGGDVGYVGFDVMGESNEMRREDVLWCQMGINGFTFRRCSIE